ncbi:NACHT domain-containing protein [Pyxidicoccus trucidator]|uniref:NACHT domain-containing protein n=1 Tax=Pyxidicoccus trucidator TaxID=2709662 RepID=UPI001967567E|nr:NACHT domain-containing protein [Pyxidicoccus trucidator]
MTIEGASAEEAKGDDIKGGEELIDVGLYFGAEERDRARLIQYIQLKHSTRRAHEPWTASGLKKTINGFAQRYAKLVGSLLDNDVAQRFRFEFTTNRPIDSNVKEALADLASGAVARHPDLQQSLIEFTGLAHDQARQFFGLFTATGGEKDLWAQRNLLTQDVSAYLPDADYDSPVQLKELVARKATTEFESDPSIRRHDVLRALKATEEQLKPAPCLIPDATHTLTLPREQEPAVLRALLTAKSPLVIHAEGGVGKSVLAARLASSMPPGSEAVLYDCFGDGLYRNALQFRHRHRDALVQIANELAARSLCHPLIPTTHADAKQYMRAFIGRLAQAVGLLRASTPDARLCLIIDAADNAEMAAEEQKEPTSFVRDLIWAPLPEGVSIAFTCRTHRRRRIGAPPEAQEIELRPFTQIESGQHLRSVYSAASDAEVSEFAFLSSFNPRVQALALSRGLSLQEMLKQLGPEPSNVERAIGELLDAAIARLRFQSGAIESSQIELICQGLSVLRPLVPINVLAQLSGTSESTVRSFALDLGRPLLLKGNSLHFFDEPGETWFRERFKPDAAALTAFLERMRPLTAQSSYAAAALPQLLLQAGKLDELVELALSGEGLPTENPLEKRDVELQRLIFALKACLQQRHYVAAAKLALKAGGECAGEQRQNQVIQENTDVAAVLMAPDRIEEIVSRRAFHSGWMGSHHAYDAGLLSGRDEFSAEASSRLRMAGDWLNAWARRSSEERQVEQVSDADTAELAMALLRLKGAKAAARFLREWTPRHHTLEAGRLVGRRLIDLGRHKQLDELAEAAGNDVWLLLGVTTEARAIGRSLPAPALARLLRLLADRRVKLTETQDWNKEWTVLDAVRSAVELGLRVLAPKPDKWAATLRRYLPSDPPSTLGIRSESYDRIPLLRAYALEAALRGQRLTLLDIAPPNIRKQLEASSQYGRSEETEVFLREAGALLPWLVLSAEIACGRPPSDIADAIQQAVKETSAAEDRSYRPLHSIRQTVALEWFRILRDAGADKSSQQEIFRSWLAQQRESLGPDRITSLCRYAARSEGFEALSMELAGEAYRALEYSREDAESRAASYVSLARAVLTVSPSEARAYFDRAVEIASRIGDENLDRWAALLHLARTAGEHEKPRARTAYNLSRVAELTYEYVARDKHFDWNGSVKALTDLCASSALAILSRWRDRRFGDPARLLPVVVYRLVEQGRLPVTTPIALGGLTAEWDRLADLQRAVAAEGDSARRSLVAQLAYRYIRVQPANHETWSKLRDLGNAYRIKFPDVNRLLAADLIRGPKEKNESAPEPSLAKRERRAPDWNAIFQGVDLLDASALRSAYAAVRTYDPPYEFRTFFQEAFARVKLGRQSEFVRAIATWPDFGLYDLRHMLDALPSPLLTQLSLRKAIRDAVLLACQREPRHVYRRGWRAHLPFEKFHEEGLVSDGDVAHATLNGFVEQMDSLGASELFQLIDSLATFLSPEEADEALNFGLDLLAGVLRPEDGDGPWRPELQPPQSHIGALAGYVWAGLGSPVAAERWQCAHVVRSVVELGWSELLDALINMAQSGAADPFVDKGLEFYIWHARQWLLIGFARGALENPGALRPAALLLLNWLHKDHVLLRELAAQTLRTLAAAGELNLDEASDLGSVNRPSRPVEVYSGWTAPVEDDALSADGTLDADEKYYFGIDIGPYWLRPLGNAFGLSQRAIERRAHYAIRDHLGWSGGRKRREDARHTRKIFDEGETSHSHGSLPKTDDLSAYRGYHAMMLVAAALLSERPVRRRAEDSLDDFREWLSHYLLARPDGRWLADRRDPRLVADPPAPTGYGDTQWPWSVTADYLDQKLVTDDDMTVLWGYWTGGERKHTETVFIRSALVSRAGVEALVAALQTAPELGRLALPYAGEEDGLESGPLKLKGWVSDKDALTRLDRGDPWATGLSYPGPAPSVDTIVKLDLLQLADGRTWTNNSDGLLRSESWTQLKGYGREVETDSGVRLSANREFLKHLLGGDSEDSLVLSVEIRREYPQQASTEDDDVETLPPLYIRYYMMGADGVAHALKSRP